MDIDLEWCFTYVADASDQYDQVLDTIMLGPVAVGSNFFTIQVNPPNFDLIPSKDWVGVTGFIISCKYQGQEFIRVGYYVRHELEGYKQQDIEGEDIGEDEEEDMEEEEEMEDDEVEGDGMETDAPQAETNGEREMREMSAKIDLQQVRRTILSDNPRVTHFKINWE